MNQKEAEGASRLYSELAAAVDQARVLQDENRRLRARVYELTRDDLVSAAAQAIEMFDEDDLERFAAGRKAAA